MKMPTRIGDTTYLSVDEASRKMGCTSAWVRHLCREGKLEGALRHGARVWLVPEKSAKVASGSLTTRSLGKKAKQ